MADKKITELTPTTGANLSDADEFVVVDVSADETKSVTRAEFFKNTPSIISSGTISSSKTSGYGGVEVGGPSGGLIDLKAPASDDYDARIIYNAGTDLQIITLADEPILLRQGNTTRLKTTTTGIDVTGTITSDGLRFPNMTTTQKNAMADVAGVQVFDTTLGKMCFNTGSAWETMTSS